MPVRPDDTINKTAWMSHSSGSSGLIEGKMLEECSGMFGVMEFYHSVIIHHKKNLPAHNHLWLDEAEPWDVYGGDMSKYVKDYRTLLAHHSRFAGESLVTANTSYELFKATAHGALGENVA